MAEESKVLAELAALREEMKKATPPPSTWDALEKAIETPDVEAMIKKSLPPASFWTSIEKSVEKVPVDERAAFIRRVMTFVSVALVAATAWLAGRSGTPQVVYIERTPVPAPVVVDAGADQ